MNIIYNLPHMENKEISMVKEAIEFYMEYLKIEETRKEYNLLQIQNKPCLYAAYVEMEEEEDNTLRLIFNNTSFTPRFPFEGKSYSLLEVLAHEMVHVKQNTSKRLKIINCLNNIKAIKWEEEVYSLSDIISLGMEAPWEIEAYTQQREIYNAFIQHKHGVIL